MSSSMDMSSFGNLHSASALLLMTAVVVVGVLHTVVPDHWIPIGALARQHGWSRAETAWAAARAGTGHVFSTLLIGVVVWLVGISTAQRFGGVMDTLSSLALMAFGGWCILAGWNELRHYHGSAHHDSGEIRHVHLHEHEGRKPHIHVHAHAFATAHPITSTVDIHPPLHSHDHKVTGRGMLLVILGSSPMIEGIPAFFAAAKFGAALMVLMSFLFALSTIATYIALCVYSAASLERLKLGPLERYGEVLSGGFIVLVGIAFWIWPAV